MLYLTVCVCHCMPGVGSPFTKHCTTTTPCISHVPVIILISVISGAEIDTNTLTEYIQQTSKECETWLSGSVILS